jgi:hypothetical protein
LNIRTTLAALAGLAIAPMLANAGVVTLTMENGNDGGDPFNTTFFTITNNSAPGIDLTEFSLAVGDTQYNFDQIYQSREAFFNGNGTQSASLLVGDRAQDGVVTDLFTYSFTNFAPAVRFEGQWDIDNDNGDFNADTRLVFFNNGAAPNAVATFIFSDGQRIDYTFPDLPIQDRYSIVIPAPAAGLLPIASLLTLARRRR